jgi:hypothetical protein
MHVQHAPARTPAGHRDSVPTDIPSSCEGRWRGMLCGGSTFATTDAFRSLEYATVRTVLRPPQGIINS